MQKKTSVQIATCPVGTCAWYICEFANPSHGRGVCCQANFAAQNTSQMSTTRRHRRVGRPSSHPRSNFRALSLAQFRPCSFIERVFCERQLLYHIGARVGASSSITDALDNGPGRRRCCGRPRPDAVSHSAAAISLTAVRALYRNREMTLAAPRPCSSPTFISRCLLDTLKNSKRAYRQFD